MKTKKLEKRLILSKRIIARLNGNEMNFIYGGITDYSICICDTRRQKDCDTGVPTCEQGTQGMATCDCGGTAGHCVITL